MEAGPIGTEGVRWRPGSTADLDALHALVNRIDAVDDPAHPLPRGEFDAMVAAVDPAAQLLLGHSEEGLVAFAWRRRPGGDTVRLIGGVRPDRRRRGIGRRLLAWQVRDAQTVEADAATLTVRQADRSDVGGVAARAGFRTERTFLSLRRDAGDPPRAGDALPAPLTAVGFETRFDEPLRVAKNEVFRDHWRSTTTSEEAWRLEQLGPELRRDLSALAIAPDGGVAGFVLLHEVEGPDGDAYVPLVGTARAWRGRGVAHALLAEVLRRAAGAGYPGVALDVDAASPTGADRLYRDLGFVEVSHAVIWGRPLR